MNEPIPDFGFVPLDSRPGELGAVTRADVVAAARSWIGTPYVHQHRAKAHAVDCAGLVIGVARELGLVAPDFDVNGYARLPDGVSLMQACDEFMTRVERADMKPGHVIVIRWESDPQHMGILGDYLHGGLSMIHAANRSDGKGDVREHRLDAPHRARIVQVYSLPGVTA